MVVPVKMSSSPGPEKRNDEINVKVTKGSFTRWDHDRDCDWHKYSPKSMLNSSTTTSTDLQRDCWMRTDRGNGYLVCVCVWGGGGGVCPGGVWGETLPLGRHTQADTTDTRLWKHYLPCFAALRGRYRVVSLLVVNRTRCNRLEHFVSDGPAPIQCINIITTLTAVHCFKK